MKHHHPSKQTTPKRAKLKRPRVQYQLPREETPFSKPHKRRLGIADGVYLGITVIAGSALLGLCHSSFATYSTIRSTLTQHSAQLAQLKTREDSLHQRLVDLKSPDGRNQLLRERGFVQGHERILLFPDDAQLANTTEAQPTDTTAAQTLQTDVSPNPVSAQRTSFWGGIVHAIDGAADSSAVH